jgi:soluble cytochrome b562
MTEPRAAPESEPTPSPGPVRDPGAVLDDLVARLRRRALLVHGGTAAALLVAAGALVALATALAFAAGAGEGARTWARLALAAAGAGAAAFLLFRLRRTRPAHLARELERRDPRAAGLESAVELLALLRAPGEPPFSLELARAHVLRSATRAAAVDPNRAFDLRPLKRAAAGAGAAVLAVGVLGLAVKPVGGGLKRLLAPAPGAPAPTALEPITGEIELTYLYPVHTGLPTRTVPASNGEITAPRGTTVKLRTRADRDVEKASIVIDGTAALPLEVEAQRFLSGELQVSRSGTYAFRFEDSRGRAVAVGPPLAIAALDDAVPEVTLLAPEEELVVTERDALEIVWEASDDYGLGGLELVYQVAGGEEHTAPVAGFPEPVRRSDGTHRWELSPLDLDPGDVVTYYLRATDNDGVSGPKRGQSRTQRLKVFSEAEHRRELLAKLEAAWEAMVAGLGDRIAPREGPRRLEGEARIAAGRPADEAVQAVVDTLASLGAELRKDERAPEELGLAAANIARTLGEKARTTRSSRAAAEARSGALPPLLAALDRAEGAEQRELEKDVLYLEALLDRQRLEEMRALARELADGRQELARRLEELKAAPTDAAKRAAREEVGRLRERLLELMKAMAQLQRGIQDFHLNREALAELSKERDLLGGLDEIEKLLDEGKIDEAMQALEKLGEQMDRMAEALEEARDSQAENDPALRELAEQLQGFERELSELREEQQEIARETEALKREQRREVEERLGREGANLVDELRAKVERARVQLAEVPAEAVAARFSDQLDGARERLEEVDATLAVKDFDAALESVTRALAHERLLADGLETERELSERYERDNLRAIDRGRNRVGEAARLTEEVKKALERLLPNPAKSMDPAARQKMEELSRRQASLEQRAGQLQQKAARIGEKAPIFDPSAQEAMSGAKRSMGQARSHLQGKDPGKALAAERRADEQLESLQQGLEELKERARGNKSGMGFPLPLAMGGRPGDEDGRDGRMDPKHKVVIPGADQYRVPEEYRKDILDAMKQGTPEGFEEDVRGYYEEIIK